jgi:hypothetical protein
MYVKWLPAAKEYLVLQKIDEDLAAMARTRGCSCGGVLHSARYPRKPRGGPEDLDARYGCRLSFCCAVDGCRARTTPASVRFLGRKVYLGAVVVLTTVLRHGSTPERMAQLKALFGVSARTVRRWRGFWQATFVQSEFWLLGRGRFMPVVDEAAIPLPLLERFAGSGFEQLAALLRWLSPITTRTMGDGFLAPA